MSCCVAYTFPKPTKTTRSPPYTWQLTASSFDDFFEVLDKQRLQLPVVTNEIGDTWIHGIASDPYKTAAMRALMRAHARVLSSYSSPPRLLPDGFSEFERLLLKCPEHTWGGDQKMFLHYGAGGDYFNWSNSQFQAAAADGEFDVTTQAMLPLGLKNHAFVSGPHRNLRRTARVVPFWRHLGLAPLLPPPPRNRSRTLPPPSRRSFAPFPLPPPPPHSHHNRKLYPHLRYHGVSCFNDRPLRPTPGPGVARV